MSADKRTVTTDALETLGMIITEKEKRDAIHLAVEPVIAGVRLYPGDHVRLENGRALRADTGKGLGIVDPFLEGHINPDDRFWLVVYPRQIKSLRHVWEHPSFPESDATLNTPSVSVVDSEQWLHDFCKTNDVPDYETLMKAIRDEPLDDDGYVSISKEGTDYWVFIGIDAHCEVPAEFWQHVEVVLGRKLDDYEKTEHFSCSC